MLIPTKHSGYQVAVRLYPGGFSGGGSIQQTSNPFSYADGGDVDSGGVSHFVRGGLDAETVAGYQNAIQGMPASQIAAEAGKLGLTIDQVSQVLGISPAAVIASGYVSEVGGINPNVANQVYTAPGVFIQTPTPNFATPTPTPTPMGATTGATASGDPILAAYQAGDYAKAQQLINDQHLNPQDIVTKYNLGQADAATVAKNLGFTGSMSGLNYNMAGVNTGTPTGGTTTATTPTGGTTTATTPTGGTNTKLTDFPNIPVNTQTGINILAGAAGPMGSNLAGGAYNQLLGQGFTDKEIRDSAIQMYGTAAGSDPNWNTLVQSAGMNSPSGRPLPGSAQFYQPVYTPQYKDYANPLLANNVSSYGIPKVGDTAFAIPSLVSPFNPYTNDYSPITAGQVARSGSTGEKAATASTSTAAKAKGGIAALLDKRR